MIAQATSEATPRPAVPGRPAVPARSAAALLLLAVLAACSPRGAGTPSAAPAPELAAALDADAHRWVDEILAGLSLREAVAQLVVPWIPGGYASETDPDFQELLGWVEKGLGGVSISIGVPDAYVAKLNRLQSHALVPLLVTSDFENGGPGMRINHSYAIPSLLPQGGGTSFPPTMAFGASGDEALAFEFGRITAKEARAVGVHWLFAPVLDVNSNPANPVIATRSFGEDPEAVGRLGAAFIRGARRGGALSTAKHFPGHGDTRTDSHIVLPVIGADRERLDRVELAPFRTALAAGVDAVMTAHVAVPGVLGDERPATLSPYFMTDVLRDEMGFDGILFTDALRMGAITNGYGAGEAAVLSLEAGSDVLLAPDGIGRTIDAVARAVESGRISRTRIERSVRRLLEAKARLGLHRESRVDPGAVALRVGTAENRAVAARAAAKSITLVRDRDGAVPLAPGVSVTSVTWARDGDLLAGRAFDAALRGFAGRVARVRVGPDTPWATYDSLLLAAADADAVVIGVYAPPRSGAGATALSAGLRTFVERVDEVRPGAAVVVSFGGPYVLSAFPDVGSYVVAWGDRELSQRAAARALTGAEAIGGRLPVSIPPLHRAGDGVDRAAGERNERNAQAAPDPLQEAGFVPPARRNQAEEQSTASDTAGGPGRWRPSRPLPACDERPPALAQSADDLSDAFCTGAGTVVSLREVDPLRVAMSPDSLSALDDAILSALADSAASGAALAIVRRGQLVRLRGYGRLDWDANAPAATPASIFDLASLTKVVGTTTAAVVLAQRGALGLDDAVAAHLPWWDDGDPAKSQVTLRQLLLHQAGLPPFRRFYLEIAGRDAYRDAIGALPLDDPPGLGTVYSDIGLMTVAFVAEEVSGQPLDDFLRAEVWRPLGMGDTGFNPPPSSWDRIASTEIDTVYRGYHVHGEVHDENAHAVGGVAGHAGLFSSARDLAVFVQMMLDRGVAGPCRADAVSGLPCHRPRSSPVAVFGPGWVDRITRRQSPESSRALGWDTPSGRSSAGDWFSARSFGHTGYTGTSIWIDPTLDLGVVLLTNRVNPTRENAKHVPLRRRVHDLAARAIIDTPPRRREP